MTELLRHAQAVSWNVAAQPNDVYGRDAFAAELLPPVLPCKANSNPDVKNMPFFTALDSRAEVKGSRDPLGLVPLWSRLGRYVVGNLTTASSSARGFTTLLIGYRLAEVLSESATAPSALEVFLRFEQIAAYSRLYRNDDVAFRGERRARRTQTQTSKPPIGVGADRQILSDQKIYGLWGLYSTPARNSGLLRRGEPVLATAGRELTDRIYMSRLRAGGGKLERQLLALVRDESTYYIDGQHSALADLLAQLLQPSFTAAERSEYEYYLVHGGPDDSTSGDQRRLSQLLRGLPATQPFGIAPLQRIITAAHKLSDHERLADNLQNILHVEHVIIPLQAVFLFALARDGDTLSNIANAVAEAWGMLEHVSPDGFARVRTDIEVVYASAEAADRLIMAAQALASGDHETVLKAMLDHNAFVMRERNGSDAWARLNGDRIDVRYRDESENLPPRSQLPSLWRSTYFVDALKGVINQIDA